MAAADRASVREDVADELAALWRALPPMGWLEQAACGDLGWGGDVFTADHPDTRELALAEAVCRRCPVLSDCASYAAQVPV